MIELIKKEKAKYFEDLLEEIKELHKSKNRLDLCSAASHISSSLHLSGYNKSEFIFTDRWISYFRRKDMEAFISIDGSLNITHFKTELELYYNYLIEAGEKRSLFR